MNANWSGLLDGDAIASGPRSRQVVARTSASRATARRRRPWYSVFAIGPGIFGLGNRVYPTPIAPHAAKPDVWSLANPDHVNGGINHFGSPFNFPEEFVTVYRLHALAARPDRVPRPGTPTRT